MLLIDSLLGDFFPESRPDDGFKLLWIIVVSSNLTCCSRTSVFAFTKGDLRPTTGENFSKLSDESERGVQFATPFSNGDCRSSFVFLSSIIGVVSPEVIVDFFPPMFSSRLMVGLSTKLNELHSSEVGETSGVNVVSDSGFVKKVSSPSPRLCESSVNKGRVGARTLARFGRLFTKCCNANDVLGSSVIESQFSSSMETPLAPRFEMFGDSNKSGMWLKLRLSIPNPTTLWGRILLIACRFDLKCGIAWFGKYTISWD